MSTTGEAPPIERQLIDTYRVAEGRRGILAIGRKNPGGYFKIKRLVDVDVDGAGRPYVIEDAVDNAADAAAIVADYLEQAEDLGHCPMSRAAISEKIRRGVKPEEALS